MSLQSSISVQGMQDIDNMKKLNMEKNIFTRQK